MDIKAPVCAAQELLRLAFEDWRPRRGEPRAGSERNRLDALVQRVLSACADFIDDRCEKQAEWAELNKEIKEIHANPLVRTRLEVVFEADARYILMTITTAVEAIVAPDAFVAAFIVGTAVSMPNRFPADERVLEALRSRLISWSLCLAPT